MKYRVILLKMLVFWATSTCFGQKRTIVYKTFEDSTSLKLKVIEPINSSSRKSACAVFLSGGGWMGFSWSQLDEIAFGLSDQGLTSVMVQYRTKKTHNSTPFEALQDVKDAIVFLRKNADSLNINENQIITIGSSAGGHLAFSSYITDDQKKYDFSPRPNYIIAISPVLRNDESGYGYDRIGLRYKTFSPFYLYLNSKKRLPPSLIFSGQMDSLINFRDLQLFHQKSIKKADRMHLYSLKNVGHSMKNKYKSLYIQIYPIIAEFLKKNNITLDYIAIENQIIDPIDFSRPWLPPIGSKNQNGTHNLGSDVSKPQ